MNYLSYTQLDLNTQRKLLLNYESKLDTLPQGKLSVKTSANGIHYYLNNKKYLGSKDIKLIQSIKTRAYLEKSIKVMSNNIKYQEKLLEHYKPYDFSSINDSLSPAYKSDYKISSKDPTNEFSFGSAPIHRTSFGLYTRSRAEAFIAEMLYAEGIKFTYEEPLDLLSKNGEYVTLHPDFTIYLSNYEKKYWEHAGLLNDVDYRSNFLSKLELYFDNNITIPSNLIITMDTKDGAFDGLGIQKIIETLI